MSASKCWPVWMITSVRRLCPAMARETGAALMNWGLAPMIVMIFICDQKYLYKKNCLDRIDRIFRIISLYLKFPEEISNEQSAMPKRETLFSTDLRDRLLKVMKNNPAENRRY